MSSPQSRSQSSETQVVRVHYWAAAKSAAGVAGDDLPVDGPISLAEVVRRAVELHPDTRLGDVLKSCSALLGDRPVTAAHRKRACSTRRRAGGAFGCRGADSSVVCPGDFCALAARSPR